MFWQIINYDIIFYNLELLRLTGKPEVMGNCSVTNQTTTTLCIECEPGFDGGLLQDFIMEAYSDDNSVLLTNVTSRVPWFIISGLAEGTFLNIYLYSVNTKGLSDRIYIRSHTLRSAQRQTGILFSIFVFLFYILSC